MRTGRGQALGFQRKDRRCHLVSECVREVLLPTGQRPAFPSVPRLLSAVSGRRSFLLRPQQHSPRLLELSVPGTAVLGSGSNQELACMTGAELHSFWASSLAFTSGDFLPTPQGCPVLFVPTRSSPHGDSSVQEVL